jgi:hypothetical protein
MKILCASAQDTAVVINWSAQPQGALIHLSWQTTLEVNCAHFTVYYSLDSISYSPRANIPASGNSSSLHSYQIDDSPWFLDTCYFYVLKAYSIDGAIIYTSNPIKACILTAVEEIDDNNRKLSAFYSQSSNEIVIRCRGLIHQEIFSLINSNGKIIYETSVNSSLTKINCEKFPYGFYYSLIDNLPIGKLIIY